MKKCVNCKTIVKENDKYCRNCGCILKSNFKRVIINILITIITLGLLFMIALFVASYIMNN